jgi:hypothetical protein
MKYEKSVYVLIGILLIALGTGAFYLAKREPIPVTPSLAAQSSLPAGPGSPAKSAGVEEVDLEKVTENVTNFLGSLTPGGTAESTGRERTYVVSYQVDFLRKNPRKKVPEESLSYAKLRDRDLMEMPPYLYYGETVSGKYDPAQPEVIPSALPSTAR